MDLSSAFSILTQKVYETDNVLNFLTAIHRSIFEPQFYKEVISAKRGMVIGFLIKQILLIAFISAAAQVFYLTDPKRGIVDDLQCLFSGIEIHHGKLHSAKDVPYALPSNITMRVLDKLSGMSSSVGKSADSLVMIDTNSTIHYPLKPLVFLLRSDRLEMCFNSSSLVVLPYDKLFSSTDSIVFTHSFIEKFIKARSILLCAQMFVSKILENTVFLSFSAAFLALAAFLFRVDKTRSLQQYFKVAFFAISPITVGSVLLALSGVRVNWMWNVLVFISTIVMFRGMLASIAPTENNGGEIE